MLYTIKPGDTLANIARMHRISLGKLLEFNRKYKIGLEPLKAGDQLQMPDRPGEDTQNDMEPAAAPGDEKRIMEDGAVDPVAGKNRPLDDDFDFQSYREEFELPHWSQRSGLLAVVLLAVVFTIIAVVSLFGYRLYSLNKDNSDLRSNLTNSQEEVRKLKADVEKFQKDLDALLKGQLPGLTKIDYDRVIPINQNYLNNISFNRVNNRNIRGYEFRVTMRNDTLSTIWPKIKINFFNKHGLQMNFIQVGVEKDSFMQVDTLNPGEERADPSPVVGLLENEELPTYFMLQLN